MGVLLDQNNAMVGGRTVPINLAESGQNGAMMAPHQWVASGGYQKQKVIPVLLAVPKLMKYMDNSAAAIASLKALMEVQALEISGLNSTVNWDFHNTPVGNAGEEFHTVISAKRDPSNPSYRWSDKHGAAVQRFWTEYGRLILMDADLSVPGIVAAPAYIADSSPAILPDMQGMVMLFIEPDATLRNVTHAWLCANMMPKTGGSVEGKREVGGSSEVPEVSIEFTATTMIGKEVIRMSKEYLASLKLQNLRPTELKPFVTGASADVNAASTGFKNKIDESVSSL